MIGSMMGKIVMKRVFTFLLLLSFVVSVPFVHADDGMWTFDNPPLKQWKERYNFEPSKEWLDKVRLASPKVSGASAGFVSPNGLLATNHHVAAGYIARLSTKERDLMKTGFYAKHPSPSGTGVYRDETMVTRLA